MNIYLTSDKVSDMGQYLFKSTNQFYKEALSSKTVLGPDPLIIPIRGNTIEAVG